METKNLLAVFLLAAIVALAGCSSEVPDESGDDTQNPEQNEFSEEELNSEIESGWMEEGDDVEIGEMI